MSSVSFSWRCSSRSTCTWTTRSATSWMARPTLTSGTRRTDGSASPWTRGTWSPCQPASTIASPWTRAYALEAHKRTHAPWGGYLYGDARCWRRSHLITSANVWKKEKYSQHRKDIECILCTSKTCKVENDIEYLLEVSNSVYQECPEALRQQLLECETPELHVHLLCQSSINAENMFLISLIGRLW